MGEYILHASFQSCWSTSRNGPDVRWPIDPPAFPCQTRGAALWAGVVDLEWDEVPAADGYEVQYYRFSKWIDLPGNGIEIAYYGAGAVVKGLPHSTSYEFRVRAVNSHGASEWSDSWSLPQTGDLGAWAGVPELVNSAATGTPTISGTFQVGETLTADVSSISDENGLERVKFRYKWISSDGTKDADIRGAKAASYTLTRNEAGDTIEVRVSFVDRHGFSESLTSDAVETVETDFLALNQAAGYGLLRELDADERPHPRDIVIYEALPNDLPRVSGIISSVPQTPLSHVNLRALQDGVPNAFIPDALENDDISDLIGSHVYYQVTDTGYTIRAATQAEVETHFASSRPARTQTPQSDLTVTAITPLSDIGFDDWDAFGVRAANVAVLGTLEFPEGTVPDGFAIPFYFYDEFMKHNDLDDDIEDMLADSDFQTDYDTMASELKKLRKKIKEAEVPEWIETALTTMHGTYPDGQSLRYRSSTNNEDLPNFNGAGLYDSETQNPEETEEDGISKSLKQVYASLWNFRAFLERDFHRIDHLSTYMGALVHPNYSDDRVNGVAVSADPATGTWRSYYVNAQVGEDLVTNPEVNSVPEELLLNPRGKYTVLALSNQVRRGDLLMTDDQMAQLRRRLDTIHDRFEELYGVRSGEPFAMEIEFKVTSDNVLAIRQARPWVFPPLTGRFDLDIAAHGGSPFMVRIRFSAPTTIIRSNLRDRAVSVTGGRVTGARRTTYSPISEWWEIDVTPDSLGDVTVAVAHNRPCNNVAAICTSDGKRLSNRLERTIKGYLNNPATGLPTISGTAQVGETLTADTSGIVDEDGLENVSYSYQWLRNDGTTDSGIQDATDSTYALVSDDSGKAIKVRVSFTDDAGNDESLTSEALEVPVWPHGLTATASEGDVVLTWNPPVGFSYLYDYQILRNRPELGEAEPLVYANTGTAETTYTDTDVEPGVLYVYRVKAASYFGRFTEASEPVVIRTPTWTPVENTPATGAPAISGDLVVGQTLRVDTSAIEDDDGLDKATFTYQWLADDTDIQNATDSTYILTDSEEGKAIKVTVSFTDDAGNGESLSSAATAAVEPAPTLLTAGFNDTPSSHDGETAFTFELRLSEEPKPDFSYKTLRDHAFTVTGGEVDGARRLEPESATPNIRWEITVAPDGNGSVSVVLPATTDCTAQGAICTGDGKMLSGEASVTVAGPEGEEQQTPPENTPATGAPAISGTAQVGETLTADTSGIADSDGTGDAAFAYQWLADDTDISGATASRYTLVDSDEGKAIKVRVSFNDDAGNAESLTSSATAAVAAAPALLTAEFLDTPSSHDGNTAFTFELRFSEEFELSYKTLRDHAFTVTGGEVTGARRLDRDSATPNIRWEITVAPDGNGDVTIVLPITTDCDTEHAICTGDGRRLSNRTELTVSGPGG